MTDAIILSDPQRTPIIAQRRKDAGVSLRMGRSHIVLSSAEIERLIDFIDADEQCITQP
jgi:hypothetical protein